MDTLKTFGKRLYTFNNQAVLWGEPDVAGYLDKRGGNFATWNRRFFILQGSSLFYFPNPFNIRHPLGVLPMEGSGLEPAGVEEGGPQRKWCFRIKLGAQFGMAKRSIYVFAAPSKQAQEEWLENLRYAATTRADLIDYLQKSRRVGADFRFKLSKSPANLRMIEESRRGPEGYALLEEMAKLRKRLVFLTEQPSQIKSQSEHLEANVMLVLATWDLFAQHLADEVQSDYRNKLESELNLITELAELLKTKADYMEGIGLETLDEDARTELQKTCEDALTKNQEHQATIRIKAPRYTTEVNPDIFPENDERFKHTSEIFTVCSKLTANKKLLALQRTARENEKEARSGWIISKMGALKSVASVVAKSSVQDMATKLKKEVSTVKKFIDTDVPTVSKFIDKGKILLQGAALDAKSKVPHPEEAEWENDLTNFSELLQGEEVQGVNKSNDKGKALQQGGVEPVMKADDIRTTILKKEVSTVKKFIDTDVPTISKFIDKGKILLQGAALDAKRKAPHPEEEEWENDMTNFSELMQGEELQCVNKSNDKGKALQQGGVEPVMKADDIRTRGTSLGWKALNRMKLQRFKLQRVFPSFWARPESLERKLIQKFRFNPRYLSGLKPRPRSANASVSESDFRGTEGYGINGASTSKAHVPWTPRPQGAGNSRTLLIPNTSKQFQAEYGTDESDSSGFVSEDGKSTRIFFDQGSDSSEKDIGITSRDEMGRPLFFDEEEDPGPELRIRPKDVREVVAKHSTILKNVPGFRPNSMNHVSQDNIPVELSHDSREESSSD